MNDNGSVPANHCPTATRRYLALLLRVAGKKLELRSNTVALALCFLYKAYQKGWKPMSTTMAGMSALFLAAKVDETPRSVRAVGGVMHALENPESIFMPLQLHWENKKKVVVQEHLLLRFLQFDVNMDLPYKLALNFIQTLNAKAAVAQVTISLLDDTLAAWADSHFASQDIAVAAVYIALKLTKQDDVPRQQLTDTAANESWWELLGSQKVPDCCLLLLEELRESENISL